MAFSYSLITCNWDNLLGAMVLEEGTCCIRWHRILAENEKQHNRLTDLEARAIIFLSAAGENYSSQEMVNLQIMHRKTSRWDNLDTGITNSAWLLFGSPATAAASHPSVAIIEQIYTHWESPNPLRPFPGCLEEPALPGGVFRCAPCILLESLKHF